jgi:hypothetical protein
MSPSSNTLQEAAHMTAQNPPSELLTAQLRSLVNIGLEFGLSLSRVSNLMGEVVRERLPMLLSQGHATPDEGLATLLQAAGGCVEVEKARYLFRKPQPVTRQAMAQQIRNGNVLAYRSGGGDYLVPIWQFRPEGGVWEGLPLVLTAIRSQLDDQSPLTPFAFLLQAHPLTRGRPPLEALRQGQVQDVLAAVTADAR